MAYAARACNCRAPEKKSRPIDVPNRGSVELATPSNCDDVALALQHRVQKVGNRLQSIGHFKPVSRLVVTGVQTTADAPVSEQGRDDVRRMTQIAGDSSARPSHCVRRDVEPDPAFDPR